MSRKKKTTEPTLDDFRYTAEMKERARQRIEERLKKEDFWLVERQYMEVCFAISLGDTTKSGRRSVRRRRASLWPVPNSRPLRHTSLIQRRLLPKSHRFHFIESAVGDSRAPIENIASQ